MRSPLRLPPVVVLLIVGACSSACADEFVQLIERLQTVPPAWRSSLVDSLRRKVDNSGSPLVVDSTAHFVYFGPGKQVCLAGDMTDWQPRLPLKNIPGTAFWHCSLPLPADARVDYKFVIDNETWLLDPLNPRQMVGGFGPNSELVMPGYVQPPEILDRGAAPCRIFTHEDFGSPQLNDRRTIKVVTPPNYDPGSQYPVLIVHDGLEYLSLAGLALVLANVAAERPQARLPICVCVPPVQRTAEYAEERQEAFGRFITETVIPFVVERYATRPDDPAWWGNMGASYGGHVSLYLAETYPHLFRKIAAMSPYVPAAQAERLVSSPPRTYRVYLNWGRYDLQKLIPLIEEFRDLLEQRGVPHKARRYNEGHSWGLWRATIDEAVTYLFAPCDDER